MSNLNKDYELEFFIKDKLLDESPNQENVFILYIKAITSSLTKLYSKFKNIDYSIACSESVHSIFWIILNYSNNLKLTMFLCDRAIVLFMEYIELSVNINENLNLLEIKLFIYKKSIGPLVLSYPRRIPSTGLDCSANSSCAYTALATQLRAGRRR